MLDSKAMTPSHKKKRRKQFKSKKDKIFILLGFSLIILLGFIISIITKTEIIEGNLEPLQVETSEFNHNGSAVRKETQIRKDYEKNYCQKNSKWNKQYSKILENKEDDKNLTKLNLNDTIKKEN